MQQFFLPFNSINQQRNNQSNVNRKTDHCSWNMGKCVFPGAPWLVILTVVGLHVSFTRAANGESFSMRIYETLIIRTNHIFIFDAFFHDCFFRYQGQWTNGSSKNWGKIFLVFFGLGVRRGMETNHSDIEWRLCALQWRSHRHSNMEKQAIHHCTQMDIWYE